MKKNIKFDVLTTRVHISDLQLYTRYLLVYKVRRFHIYVWFDHFSLSLKHDNSLAFAIPTVKNLNGKYKHSSIEYIHHKNGDVTAFIPKCVHAKGRYNYNMMYFLYHTDINTYRKDIVRFYMI